MAHVCGQRCGCLREHWSDPQNTSKLGNKFVGTSVSVANHWSIKVMSLWLEALFSSRHSPPKITKQRVTLFVGKENFPLISQSLTKNIGHPAWWLNHPVEKYHAQIGSNAWNPSHLLEGCSFQKKKHPSDCQRVLCFDRFIEHPSNLRIFLYHPF